MENLVLWQYGCYFGSSKVIDSFGYPNVVIITYFFWYLLGKNLHEICQEVFFLQLHTYNFSVM